MRSKRHVVLCSGFNLAERTRERTESRGIRSENGLIRPLAIISALLKHSVEFAAHFAKAMRHKQQSLKGFKLERGLPSRTCVLQNKNKKKLKDEAGSPR